MKRWINDLPLRRKFLLIGAIATLALAVPSLLLIRAELAAVRAAQSEAAGLPPAEAALKLVQLTQQHRALAAQVLGGNAAVEAPRRAKQLEVDAALNALVPEAARLGKLSATLERIGRDWRSTAEDVAARRLDAPKSYLAHTALVATELDMLQDIANLSGLVLPPRRSAPPKRASAWSRRRSSAPRCRACRPASTSPPPPVSSTRSSR